MITITYQNQDPEWNVSCDFETLDETMSKLEHFYKFCRPDPDDYSFSLLVDLEKIQYSARNICDDDLENDLEAIKKLVERFDSEKQQVPPSFDSWNPFPQLLSTEHEPPHSIDETKLPEELLSDFDSETSPENSNEELLSDVESEWESPTEEINNVTNNSEVEDSILETENSDSSSNDFGFEKINIEKE